MSITGRFYWYDYMAKDTAAAEEFYRAVCGWSMTEHNAEYSMWTASTGPMGGLVELPAEAQAQGVPPHWMAYIGTSDLKGTVAKALKLGGKQIVPIMEMPEVGRWAVLADPSGATFAAFTPIEAGEDPTECSKHPGNVYWNELAGKDLKASWNFYEALFGWTKFEVIDMGEAGPYQLYGRKWPLGGMMKMQPDAPAASWTHYIFVADLDASLKSVKARGGKVLSGPITVPGGDRVAMCMDPQGGAFALDSAPLE